MVRRSALVTTTLLVTALMVMPALAARFTRRRATYVLTVLASASAIAISLASSRHGSIGGMVLTSGAALSAVVLPVTLLMSMRTSVENGRRRLLTLASRDPLTGLLNRRGLVDHAAVMGGPPDGSECVPACFGALVVDIDHLKQINDTYGHAAGDQVLVRVSAALEEAAAPHGPRAAVCRLGGEEFVVFTHGLDLESLAQSVLRVVRSTGIVTVSVGSAQKMSTCRGDGGVQALELLVGSADRAVYEAKAEGRDTFHTGAAVA